MESAIVWLMTYSDSPLYKIVGPSEQQFAEVENLDDKWNDAFLDWSHSIFYPVFIKKWSMILCALGILHCFWNVWILNY